MDSSDTKALNISTAEIELDKMNFEVVAYSNGEDLDLEGSGVVDLAWVEDRPPDIQGMLISSAPVFLVGQHNDPVAADQQAEIVAVLDSLNVESMETQIEDGKASKLWRCRARYAWHADW